MSHLKRMEKSEIAEKMQNGQRDKANLRSLKGLMETKHFGAKPKARHKKEQAYAEWKKKNPGKSRIDSPFW